VAKFNNSVLIVDDDPVNLHALVRILSKDYTVYAEVSGADCIKTASQMQPDLILLDIMMPDMNGFSVIKALKEDEATKEIPIIFVTGMNHPDDEVRGFTLGAVDYINKPYSAHVVKMRVQHQIRIINLIREIQSLSMTDALTGIGNRRYFDSLLEQEWERAKRQQVPLGFMIADIDNFKQYNDTYGHLSGDVVLQRVAGAIKSQIKRATDKVARWGGEEFAVILPNITSSATLKIAEDIRSSVEEVAILSDKNNQLSMTLSIGVHSITPQWGSEYTVADLLSDTDKALYHAKSSGKNRVCAVEQCFHEGKFRN